MAQQVYPPNVVVSTLLGGFFRYRGLEPAPRGLARGLARDATLRQYTDDDVINDMEQFGYVRIDARRLEPRGERVWVVVLVLAEGGKYALHGPDLRKLLDGVGAERPAKEGLLDEVIIVAGEGMFSRKNMTDVIGEYQKASQAGGADLAGAAPFISAHPFHVFAAVIPECTSVPPHRLMAADEVAAFLQRERLAFRDLPAVPASDPPVVWLGGREGQAVCILRPSQTAGQVPYVRRIEKGVF